MITLSLLIDDCQVDTHKELYSSIESARKGNMLTSIVLSLLAVWLTILIGCQLIGMFLGYKFFKAVAEEKNDWKA